MPDADELKALENKIDDRLNRFMDRIEGKIDGLTGRFETLARVEQQQLEFSRAVDRVMGELHNIQEWMKDHATNDDQVHDSIFTRVESSRKELSDRIESQRVTSDEKISKERGRIDKADGGLEMLRWISGIAVLAITGFVGFTFKSVHDMTSKGFESQLESVRQIKDLQMEIQVMKGQRRLDEENRAAGVGR